MQSEKHSMKIDSGIVNLKSNLKEHANVHQFNKRPSVNFPIQLERGSEQNAASILTKKVNEMDGPAESENNSSVLVFNAKQLGKQSVTERTTAVVSTVKKPTNAGRMPVSARPKKSKTSTLNTSIDPETKNGLNDSKNNLK